jgi:hypothetical protein
VFNAYYALLAACSVQECDDGEAAEFNKTQFVGTGAVLPT